MRKGQQQDSRKIQKMREDIATSLVMFLCLAVIIGIVSFGQRVRFDDKLVNQSIKVEWSTLNLREEANQDSDILYELSYGDTVILTGKYREYGVGDPDLESHWYECIVTLPDGTSITGWVIKGGLG